jgi:hypothetical protein
VVGAWVALLGLAGARTRRRTGSLLAVALGVAAAAAAVLAATPLSLVARQSALERGLAAQPAADRALRLTFMRDGPDGGPGQLAALDTSARDGLRGDAFTAGVARAVRFGGRPAGRLGSVVLTGVDAPGRWLRLRSGRLPRSCDAAACEVVAVAGRRLPAALRVAGVRLRWWGPAGSTASRSGRCRRARAASTPARRSWSRRAWRRWRG